MSWVGRLELILLLYLGGVLHGWIIGYIMGFDKAVERINNGIGSAGGETPEEKNRRDLGYPGPDMAKRLAVEIHDCRRSKAVQRKERTDP